MNQNTDDVRIRDFLDEANDLIQSVGPDGSILFVNQKWLKTLGYTRKELLNLNITDILREDQVPHCFGFLEKIKQGGQFEYIETVFRSKDGRDVFVEGNIDGQFEDGQFISTRGIFRDITNRKILEVTNSRLVKDFPQPIYVISNNLFVMVNPNFQKMTGYPENELLRMESIKLVHPDDTAYVYKNRNRSLKASRSFNHEFRMLRKSGEVRWVMETLVSIPYGGGQALLGTLVDFTERKMVEGALEEARNRYQTLFNSATDPVYLHDMNCHFIEVNDATCKLLGYNRSDLLKMTVEQIVSPRFASSVPSEIKELTEKGANIFESENITSDGKMIPMEINIRMVDYEKKKVAMVSSRDITERKQVENIRKRIQSRLESLVKISELKSDSIHDMLSFSLAEIVKLTESKMGYLYYYNERQSQFAYICWSEELIKVVGRQPEPITSTLEKSILLGKILAEHQPIVNNCSPLPDPETNGYPEGRFSLERTLSVPVIRENEIVAVISLANKKSEYDLNDVQQVALFMDSLKNIIDRRNAETAMRESEYRYRELIEMSKDAIVMINQEGKAVMTNPAACEMFGYSESEFYGLDLLETYLPEERDSTKERLKEIRNNRTLRFERQAVSKDGRVFPVEVSISPLSNGLFQDVMRDISARKRMQRELQSSEQKYRLLVENQADLVVEIDTNGEFLFVNPAFVKLMGKSKEELLNSTMHLLTYHEDTDITAASAAAKRVSNFECRMKTHKGLRWVAWTQNAVLDSQGKLNALTCMGRDITESKQAKEALEKANERLRELDKLKDNFLSTVSHELRTPLTSIKSFAEILLNYEEDRTTQQEFLGIINDESDRLTRLINEVLDLSKIQAGRMVWKREELSLAEAIRMAGNTARPLLDKAQLQLILEIDPELPTVISDKDRMVQVITNLLGNAIKFTPENGKITIKAWAENDLITVSIQDTGIGIAPENHHKIFENFGQVGDVLKDRPKGTGLGLPICKKIVENFEGKIWVESELGRGTTFLFNLPAAKKKTAVQ